MLAIHKIDGAEHHKDILWRIKFLKSVNTDEWAALCISCHRGIHWMMNSYGYDWNTLQSLATTPAKPWNLEPLDLPSENTPSSSEFLEIKSDFEGDTKTLRRAFFGETCYFCDTHYEEKKIPIHRKDGRPHTEKLTNREKYFRTLNPKEWVALCVDHHRHVHWAMDTLNLNWDDMK